MIKEVTKIVCALVWLMPAVAFAQLEEVVVTAQKREQSIQDIGLSVTAVSAERIEDASVRDVVEIAALSPNVQVNYGLGNNFFNIRSLGLNEFVGNLDAPVAVHVDEVYQSKGFMTGMALFDTERVEVLRGPQGDLFGRNTTGGTINFFNYRPESEFGTGADISLGNYDTVHVEGYVTGPISDTMSFRVSGYRTKQGRGFYTNQLSGNAVAEAAGYDVKGNEGLVDEGAIRTQLLYETDQTTLLLSLHYGEDNSELHPYEGVGKEIFTTDDQGMRMNASCPEYLDGTVEGDTQNCVRSLDILFTETLLPDLPGRFQPGETDPYTTQNNLLFTVDNETFGGFFRVDHQLKNAKFTSITAFEDFSRDQQEDSDGSPVDLVQVYWNNEFKQFTQELRLTSDFDHFDWNYVFGLFYEKDDLDNDDYLTVLATTASQALNNYSRYQQTVEAFSIFAHVEAALSPTIRYIFGTRLTTEETEVVGGNYAGTGLVEGQHIPMVVGTMLTNAADAPGGNRRSDDNLSFRFGLEVDLGQNALLFGNITTGFRSGGYSVAFATAQNQLVNLEPETITAVELGFKSQFAEDRVRINGALYHYEIEDAHIDVDVAATPVPITVNAESTTTYGGELETVVLIANALELTNSLGWTNSKITRIGEQTVNLGVDLQGNRRAFSPELTYTGQLRYSLRREAVHLVASVDYSWRSNQYLELNNQPSNLIDPFWIVNAQVSLSAPDDKWKFSVWGKNITGTEYVVYLNDLPAFGWLLRGYAAPATYGITLGYQFGG